jgi:type VI secretion system protein ImpG
MPQKDLLFYYQEELSLIRKLSAEFAEQHPKIAGRLRLGKNSVEDPHTARLIEAFALNNAKLQYKLDNEFPEFSDALLTILHPHILSPIPSMAIVQFQIDPIKWRGKKTIPGDTRIVSDERYGEVCTFTTRYSVEILPLKIEKAVFRGKPFIAPSISKFNNACSVLHLTLRSIQKNISLADFSPEKLRFYIPAPPSLAAKIYETLFNDKLSGIVLAASSTDPHPIILDKACLQPVGFSEDDNLLPYSKRTSLAHQLLLEYFSFPEKFLFFDLILTKEVQQKFIHPEMVIEIFFYFDVVEVDLEKNIDADCFALNCTPMVNLFEKKAEPFELTHTQCEYRIVPDFQHAPEATEIYAVKRVMASTDEGGEIECHPFYGVQHAKQTYYYHTHRKPSWEGKQSYPSQGTDIFLSFTDINFNPERSDRWMLDVDVICTNRDLPHHLPFSGNEPYLKLAENKIEGLEKIKCLTPLTQTRRPLLQQGARWRYISYLSFNHLSVTNDSEGISALQNLLNFFNYDNPVNHRMILEGFLGVKSEMITRRNPQVHFGNIFWTGTKITLQVDETKFSDVSLFLMGCVLDYFFALSASINSFTELVIHNKKREEICRWKPRVGDKVLL